MGYLDRDKQRAFTRTWVAKRRAEWMAQAGPCVRCGATDRLEVHHKDPTTKSSHRIWSWAPLRRAQELAKCEVLCRPCHQVETTAQIRAAHPIVHGNRNRGYRRGCRCRPCTDAAVAYNRLLVSRRKFKVETETVVSRPAPAWGRR